MVNVPKKATFGSTTTIYVGGYYEKTGSAVTKYYTAGRPRVAMRTGGQTYYLFPDHLGSTHVTANSSGAQVGRLLYRPWGETRSDEGTPQTNWRFTGQREDCRRRTIGLYFYNARYYDPVLGHFTQPDTIVPDPGDPQALNRYSYVLNNPVRYSDPTGMFSEDEIEQFLQANYGNLWQDYRNAWRSDDVFWNMLLDAQYGDVLWAPTSGLDAGVFGHSATTFALYGEYELYQYQGVGPYFLNDNPGTSYVGHPLDSQVTNQRWEQPLYDYVPGNAPHYSGYNRVVQYRLAKGSVTPLNGSGMPYVVGLGAKGWQMLGKSNPALRCAVCTIYLQELTVAMAVNNAILLEYTMEVDSRLASSPFDQSKHWLQMLFPDFAPQPA